MIKNEKQLEEKYQSFTRHLEESRSKADLGKISKAWKFAKLAHSDQKRLAGDLYITHPLEVSIILEEWKLDTTSIIAGLLHDSIEDGGATKEDLIANFGEEVALLVDGVTKVTNLRLQGDKEELSVENLRKMILVMAKDLRVIMVKLADRLHNMRTIDALPQDRQKENAIETLEIYAPLAERLGIGEVKGELEDLSFLYAYPQEYERVLKDSRIYYKKVERQIKQMSRTIMRMLKEEGIDAKIHGRKKHLWSLWRKLERPGIDWDFDKVNDVVALRILVNEVKECYVALGVVHSIYKPVPREGVSDFIAQPKPNGYRSIHTKVFGKKRRIVEIQIRTHEMHQQAEHGIAPHWVYSEAKTKKIDDKVLDKEGVVVSEEKLSWVKQLADWQSEITDSQEFLEAVKFDALEHRNFVFTPEGDVYDLPKGATPIDFAYAVHTDLGNYIKCAKVNGNITTLSYKLQSGDIVEIVKFKNAKKPNKDWLNFIVTRCAKSEIKKALK